MYDKCNCIYCREAEEAIAEERRNKRLAKLEKEAMERLLNPLEPDEYDYPYDENCDICGEDLVSSSHYHCFNCGKKCSMMGHWSIDDKLTCDPWDVWEWCLMEDIYGA